MTRERRKEHKTKNNKGNKENQDTPPSREPINTKEKDRGMVDNERQSNTINNEHMLENRSNQVNSMSSNTNTNNMSYCFTNFHEQMNAGRGGDINAQSQQCFRLAETDRHSATSEQLQITRDILYSPTPSPPPPPPPPMYQQLTTGQPGIKEHTMYAQQAQYTNLQMQTPGCDPNRNYPPPPPPLSQIGNTNDVQPQPHQLFTILQGIEARVCARLSNIETRFSRVEAQIETQTQTWHSIENTIKSQNSRICALEDNFVSLNNMGSNVTELQIQMETFGNTVKKNKDQIGECEQSVEIVSYMFDASQKENETVDKNIKSLRQEIDDLRLENGELRQRQSESEEKILDLQCRSMRDNLIFFGIEESDSEANENQIDQPEQDLDSFLQTVMKIDQKIEFHRVHRLGRRRQNQDRPRPIIAKFVNFKDREFVRFSAPDKLNDTPYGIKEQFPREIEDRRKPLYREMKKAKLDGHTTKLVKDKLFINNQLYKVDQKNENEDSDERTVYKRTSNFKKIGRIFTSRNRNKKEGNNIPNFQTPNRFQMLSQDDTNIGSQQSSKRVAKSPLENETLTKKHREDKSSSNSEREREIESDIAIVMEEGDTQQVEFSASKNVSDEQNTQQNDVIEVEQEEAPLG